MLKNIWHTKSIKAIFANFSTNVSTGLTSGMAAQRLSEEGYNILQQENQISLWRILFRQVNNLIIWVLIGAAIVSIGLNEIVDGAAILVIIVINVTIGFFQEYRADRAVTALKKLAAPRTRVIRDGQLKMIPSSEVVCGDILVIEGGDLVTADARLIETAHLCVNEASLTGESETIEKNADVYSQETALADQKNMIFFGTIILKGSGKAVVVATGMNTEVGHIAALLKTASSDETPLQRRLARVARQLLWACLGITIVIFLIGLIRSMPLFSLFLTAVSLAVAAIPEGLPTVVTLALSLGVQRMVRRNALIKSLSSVETMGCLQVICTDKTGTLTVGQMTVRKIVTAEQIYHITGEGYIPIGSFLKKGKRITPDHDPLLIELLQAGVVCNDAELSCTDDNYSIIGDPTEGALLVAGAKADLQRNNLEMDMPRIQVFPFDSDRKRMAVICDRQGTPWSFVKGAPEVILARCSHIRTKEGVREFTENDSIRLDHSYRLMTDDALRVLALAERSLNHLSQDVNSNNEAAEQGLIFLGFIGMQDPPRPEALKAIEKCKRAGIKTVMITGDHPNTARAIARELEMFKNDDEILTGCQLEEMSDDTLTALVQRITVYARVTAEHKLRIVRAWKARHFVVAMTGDGVNDAPALKEASVGLAMGTTGTEVTKEAADIIITDDNFASIVAAVEEGRGIYDNIAKTIAYLLAGNAGELIVMLVGAAIGWPLLLLPVQLLWINLVTDGLPALALAVDPIDSKVMMRLPRQRTTQLIDRTFMKQILITGVLTACVTIAAFTYEFYIGAGIEAARDGAFSTLVIAELLRAFGVRSKTEMIWEMGLFRNMPLFIVILASFFLQITIHHISWAREIFHIGTISIIQCLTWIILGCTPLLILEILKYFQRRK